MGGSTGNLYQQHLAAVCAFEAAHPDADYEPGIFSDVVGTLLHWGGHNADLIIFLTKMHALGTNVTICSSYPEQSFTDRLRKAGMQDDITRIFNKNAFAGATVALLIDDDPPPYIKAITHWNPRDIEVRRFLRAERRFGMGGAI